MVSLLGAGGMGEVYRAHDTTLGRDVALKVLPTVFTTDREKLAGVQREARTLATLNHPHIGAIYGLEEHDGTRILVLELVEGTTLADLLPRGRCHRWRRGIATKERRSRPHTKKASSIGTKPGNISITPDGIAKVLDFGLAKTLETERDAESQAPTISQTHDGALLGTVAYMSPEQAAGKPADSGAIRGRLVSCSSRCSRLVRNRRRHDGLRARRGIDDEPKWTTLPANVPAPIRILLRRCLEKDRKRRFESAADARLEIQEALAPAPAEASVAGHHPPAWQKWSIATAVLVAMIAGFAAGFASRRQQSASPMHFAIPVSGEVSQLAISSDGGSLAFVMLDEDGQRRDFGAGNGERHATPLSGTEGASYPFWSPDAAYVGFFADGKLMKVRSSGGAPQTIIAVTRDARGASWGSKNVIVTLSGRLDCYGASTRMAAAVRC